MTQETIHEVVRNRYGAIARSSEAQPVESSAACCGSSAGCCSTDGSAGCGSQLYDMAMLEGLPVDVTQLSLGCEGTQFTRSNTACCAA